MKQFSTHFTSYLNGVPVGKQKVHGLRGFRSSSRHCVSPFPSDSARGSWASKGGSHEGAKKKEGAKEGASVTTFVTPDLIRGLAAFATVQRSGTPARGLG
jgi:hypothetical protein